MSMDDSKFTFIETNTNEQPLGIPPSILSPSKRLFALRSVIALSIVIAAVATAEISRDKASAIGKLALSFSAVSAVHHFTTIFGPRSPLTPPAWLDILLTILEAIAFLVGNSFLAANVDRYKRPSFRFGGLRFQSQAFLVAFFAGWLLFCMLFVFLLLKVFDIASRWNDHPLRQRVDVCGDPELSCGKYAVRSLFGTARAVPQRGSGESYRLTLTRRVLVAVLLCLLLAFTIYEVIAAPIYDSGKIRYRRYKTDSLPQDLPNMGEGGWNMVVAWNSWQHPGATQTLAEAITVQRLVPTQPECTVKPVDLKVLDPRSKPQEFVTVNCSPATGVADVILNVNYTGILGTSVHWNWDVATVYFGLPDPDNKGRVEDIVANTEPIFLFRGSNLVAVIEVLIRKKLKPEIATLGFEAEDFFAVAGIKQMLPSIRNAAVGPLFSTLRFAPDDYTKEWTVIEDYRERSVVAGLAAVGGLGSLLSTILVVLVGTSLMSAVMRSKPYSPFGVLHNFPTLQAKILEKCEHDYPALKEDLKNQKARPGVLAFLLDTLIDLEALGYRREEGFASGPRAGYDGPQIAHTHEEKPRSIEYGGHIQSGEGVQMMGRTTR
ncbi:hypothetical protein NMY22_g4037 [Coprinellus aureogranulatus]|nr:hypothetical protein NMY22_g4037 [Coprinellus aureogranulatus]